MTTETAPGAMTGLRVIDLTRVLGGPYCTQILADHGADVIKVEPPAGDEVRDWGPPFHDDDAAYFVGINRNKRSIGLDLASEGGRAVLMKMLEGADVLIENFKPGTLDKWGIGNEALSAKFPRLVHCRISGFGGDGPRGGNPARVSFSRPRYMRQASPSCTRTRRIISCTASLRSSPATSTPISCPIR